MKLDILAVAAHPDDAEICVGGTPRSAGQARRHRGPSRGELGTRGTAQDRARETVRRCAAARRCAST
jgi:LmbE family N-acetylglucosaminyl deacetylase